MQIGKWARVTAVSLWAMPALAATDYYIKLGGVEGESTEKGQTIEVLSWSWGLSQGGTASSTKRVGAGKVQAPTAAPDASVVVPRDAASGQASGKRTAVAAGDVDGDGRAEVAAAEPQVDTVNEVTLRIRESPTLPSRARQGCAAGTHFGTVNLGGKGKQYRMQDAVVTACEIQDGVRTMKLKGHVTLLK
jgi:hypothetical protein